MDQQFIIIGIIAFFVNLVILFEIIKSATKSARKLLLQESQVRLLTSIAFKLGVDKEQISKDTQGVFLEAPQSNPNP